MRIFGEHLLHVRISLLSIDNTRPRRSAYSPISTNYARTKCRRHQQLALRTWVVALCFRLCTQGTSPSLLSMSPRTYLFYVVSFRVALLSCNTRYIWLSGFRRWPMSDLFGSRPQLCEGSSCRFYTDENMKGKRERKQRVFAPTGYGLSIPGKTERKIWKTWTLQWLITLSIRAFFSVEPHPLVKGRTKKC